MRDSAMVWVGGDLTGLWNELVARFWPLCAETSPDQPWQLKGRNSRCLLILASPVIQGMADFLRTSLLHYPIQMAEASLFRTCLEIGGIDRTPRHTLIWCTMQYGGPGLL